MKITKSSTPLPIEAAILKYLTAQKRREMQTALFIRKDSSPLPLKKQLHAKIAKKITKLVVAGCMDRVKFIFDQISQEQVLPIIMLLDDQTAITVMNAMRAKLGIDEPKEPKA